MVVQFIFSSILRIWYVEVRISQCISESPLDVEITRVDCILFAFVGPILSIDVSYNKYRTSIVRGNCVRETSVKRRNKIVQEITRNVANVFSFYAIIAIEHVFSMH